MRIEEICQEIKTGLEKKIKGEITFRIIGERSSIIFYIDVKDCPLWKICFVNELSAIANVYTLYLSSAKFFSEYEKYIGDKIFSEYEKYINSKFFK